MWNKQDSDESEVTSIASSLKEDSRASNPPSLALPHIPKRTFSRRFTTFSFSSVAQQLRKERIKKKFEIFFETLKKLIWFRSDNPNTNRFNFDPDGSILSEAVTNDEKFDFEEIHNVIQLRRKEYKNKNNSLSEYKKPNTNILRIEVNDNDENLIISFVETFLLWILFVNDFSIHQILII